MKICEWLDSATRQLQAAGVDSARLDAELLLTDVLGKPREWILAHIDTSLQATNLQGLDALLARRLGGEPMAYIFGRKEFYGRDFTVTPDVLIPRPETEQLIEIIKELFMRSAHDTSSNVSSSGPLQPPSPDEPSNFPDNFTKNLLSSASTSLTPHGAPDKDSSKLCRENWSGEVGGWGCDKSSIQILDVGTGSGVIAVTLALELPNAQIHASDISDEALRVAKQNAKILSANVKFVKSDLLQNINDKFDIIVANLPYIAREWEISPDVTREPEIALFANDGGLEFIKKLIRQTPEHLKSDGLLILELDPRQINATKKFAITYNFIVIDEKPFALTLKLLKRCRVPEPVEQKQ